MAPIETEVDLRIKVRGAVDVERAQREARALARCLDFAPIEQEMLVLSVSELATNLARYAVDGEIVLSQIVGPDAAGVQVESRDRGPGLAASSRTRANTVSHGLGAGLAGVRRLMDDFDLRSDPTGTVVVCRKWRSTR